MPQGLKKLHVLITLEQGALRAQCLEINVKAEGQSFASVRRAFELAFMSKVLLGKTIDGENYSATTRIPVPKGYHEQYKNAKPMADLLRISKFVVEFAVE